MREHREPVCVDPSDSNPGRDTRVSRRSPPEGGGDADSANRPAAGSHTESLDANHQTEAETQTARGDRPLEATQSL